MWLDRFDTILCDLDGCLISGDVVLPGAAEFVAWAGERLVVLSNNSTDTPETLSTRLGTLGLKIPAERIVLAGTAALDHLTGVDGVRLRLYGSAALKAHARQLGLDPDAEAPSHILLTRDEGFGYAQLCECVRWCEKGAELIIANPDRSHPAADGGAVPETGSLLAAIQAVLPEHPYTVIGKPEAMLYRHALSRRTGGAKTVVAIGDNPATDGLGATRQGLAHAIVGARSEDFPTFSVLMACGGGPSTG